MQISRLEHRRPPQPNVPQTKPERDRLLANVREYVKATTLIPPLTLDQLRDHANAIIDAAGVSRTYRNFTALLTNNEIWRPILAAVPFDRRLLLLPKCFRHEDACPAAVDALGLICKGCGRCLIDQLKSEAEKLGYAVMVAEGSPAVMALIESGRIEAVVGVSCLSVLERVFPYMEAAAIPGLAVPLLNDGCAETTVDLDRVYDAIYLAGDDQVCRLNLDALRSIVDSWFTLDALESVLGPVDGQSETIARDVLAGSGKRWRPFLTACAFQAIRTDPTTDLPDTVRRVALVVECFHKASLIHDDIEDADTHRNGGQTLHEQFGVPVALNVGDLLLGEGYRLIAEVKTSGEQQCRMLHTAAVAHRTLCLGQGAELCWARDPKPMSVANVLDIFRKKTAPAFEVALALGAVLAGADGQVRQVLKNYSEALGIAYQIRDDLEDVYNPTVFVSARLVRPPVLLAIAFERCESDQRLTLENLWAQGAHTDAELDSMKSLFASLQVETTAQCLLQSYKDRAILSLAPLENVNLKCLLRQVLGKIFNDGTALGCCSDYNHTTPDAPDS